MVQYLDTPDIKEHLLGTKFNYVQYVTNFNIVCVWIQYVHNIWYCLPWYTIY